MLRKLILTVLGVILICSPGYSADDDYPVEKGAQVPELLRAYFTKMSEIYPPGTKPGKDSVSLTASRTKTMAFWKLKPRDTKVPSMRSNMLFAIYQPTAWDIVKVQEAGDFARAKVTMTVGNPVQMRLKRYSRDVEYTLVKVDGNWYMTGFKESGAKTSLKDKEEQSQAAESQEQAQTADGDAEQTLFQYLKTLDEIFSQKKDSPSVNPAMYFQDAIIKTEHFWQRGKGKQRAASRSVSLFVTIQPKSWSIDSVDVSAGKATADVTITPGAPMMERLGDKKIKYELILEGNKWYIADYMPPVM